MADDQKCPICEIALDKKELISKTIDFICVSCPRCGEYEVTGSLLWSLRHYSLEKRFQLSSLTRRNTLHGGPVLRLDTYNVDSLIKNQSPAPSVLEKIDHLIEYLGIKSGNQFGCRIELNAEFDFPIIYSTSANEFDSILNHLASENYYVQDGLKARSRVGHLSTKGWERFYDLRKRKSDSNQCFVAMWFSENLDSAFHNGVVKAVQQYGMKAVRMDKLDHNDYIDDRMILEIKKSRFMVADFTGHRGGVYFEAGYARGLGLPVIFTCKDEGDWKKDLHFDVEHLPFIIWKDETELFEKLRDRIGATILSQGEL